MSNERICFCVAALVFVAAVAASDRLYLVEIRDLDGTFTYEVTGLDSYKLQSQETMLDGRGLTKAYNALKDEWNAEQEELCKDAKDRKPERFRLKKPQPRKVRNCGVFDSEEAAQVRLDYFVEKESTRRQKLAAATAKKRERMSDEKLSKVESADSSREQLLERLDGLIQDVRNGVAVGVSKPNNGKKVVRVKQGKRLGEALLTGLGTKRKFRSIDRTSKRLSSRPTKMVNTAKAKREAAAAAAEASSE